MKTNKENYYPRLDILKLFFAAVVCLFHTRMHLGCDYGPLAGLASVGGAIMTGFFMLSGYSLFTGYGKWRLRT
ncbi:MAG: hypothetical protein K5848_03770, partial [Lachnospiraceae bacterium]|nr:hypothetical protein [Lachnospiraceae bacterium]